MVKINSLYAILALVLITLLYIYISSYHKGRKGLVSIFTNALMQLNRSLQVYTQQSHKSRTGTEWRPSAVCISRDSFERQNAYQLLNWISYRFGFGTYIHLIEGYYSKTTHKESEELLQKLIIQYRGMGSTGSGGMLGYGYFEIGPISSYKNAKKYSGNFVCEVPYISIYTKSC